MVAQMPGLLPQNPRKSINLLTSSDRPPLQPEETGQPLAWLQQLTIDCSLRSRVEGCAPGFWITNMASTAAVAAKAQHEPSKGRQG